MTMTMTTPKYFLKADASKGHHVNVPVIKCKLENIGKIGKYTLYRGCGYDYTGGRLRAMKDADFVYFCDSEGVLRFMGTFYIWTKKKGTLDLEAMEESMDNMILNYFAPKL